MWAHVPFADDDGEKTRPAVVVGLRGRDVTLLPATTSTTRRRFGSRYVEIDDLAAAGLNRPTGIRTTPVVVDVIEILNIVGSLAPSDANRAVGCHSDAMDTGADFAA